MGEHDQWHDCDTEAILKSREEQTTSANVATVPVPLGTPLRRPPLGPSSPSFLGGARGAQDDYLIPSEFKTYTGHQGSRKR